MYNKKRLKRFTRKKKKIHKSLKRKRINKKILKGSAMPSVIPPVMNEYMECVEDLVVCGITSLDQYIISSDKMFSVFSEIHRSYYDDAGILSIEQFIIESWLESGNCYILLEYDPSLSLDKVDLDSHNIQNIKKLSLSKKYRVNVMGIDIRRQFINNDILYTDEWQKYNFNKIRTMFIDPLFNDVTGSPIVNLHRPYYEEHDYIYLEQIKEDFLNMTIYDDYIRSFTKIGNITFNELQDVKVKEVYPDCVNFPYNEMCNKKVKDVFYDCVLILRNQWKKCMDYYILTIVMKKDKNQYALLVGSQHGDNLYEMLSSSKELYTTRRPTYSEKECLNLKGSYFPISFP